MTLILGITDGGWLKAPGGFLTADDEGKVSFMGFLGGYEVMGEGTTVGVGVDVGEKATQELTVVVTQ